MYWVLGAGVALLAAIAYIFANKAYRRRATQGRELLCPNSEEDLLALLEDAGIDVTRFGQGQAKSVAALLHEVEEGSCRLEWERLSGTLRRVVEPVFVKLRYGERVLVERAQVLPSGKRRERNSLLAEKRDPSDADPFDAALRGIREELKVHLQRDTDGLVHHQEEDKTTTESTTSFSYPGMQAEYLTHYVSLELVESSAAAKLFAGCGLVEGAAFETEESKPEGILRLHWEWVNIDEAVASRVKGLPTVTG